MATTLVQTALFKQRTFELQPDCIRLVDRNLLGGRSYDVPYEVMFGQKIEHRTSAAASLVMAATSAVVAIFFGVFAITDPPDNKTSPLVMALVAAACVLLSLGFAVHWRLSRRELLQYFDTDSTLWIRRDRPNVEVVEAFLEEARKRARERVRSRVLPLPRTDNERKDRAYALLLRDKGIISADECAAFVKPPHSPYRDRLG